MLEFDSSEYSADLGLAVGDALVEASPSVVACNSVTFSTTDRRRLAVGDDPAEALMAGPMEHAARDLFRTSTLLHPL